MCETMAQRADGDVLTGGVDIAKAALKPPTLEQGGSATQLIHQIDGLNRALGRVHRREAHVSSFLYRYGPAGFGVGPHRGQFIEQVSPASA